MYFPIFLSVVLVIKDKAEEASALLKQIRYVVEPLVSDYEIVIVDNASQDDSVAKLKSLTGQHGFPNLQVYALTKEVDADTATWVGLENSLGDFVAVIDPLNDDAGFIPTMLEHAVNGADVVFASNKQRPNQSLAYRACSSVFNGLYKHFNNVHLAKDAPQFRLLNKKVVNFILQHAMPSVSYRHLPATGGFTKVNLDYESSPKVRSQKRLGESIDRGMRLLVSTTRGPMRLVTMLSLFGAVSNLVYSVYVIAVALLKDDVAAGWVTLSLQQSGMFLLLSLVLLVLGEYILHMASLSNEAPLYHVAQEFTSAVVTRRQKLNIEEKNELSAPVAPPVDYSQHG